MNGPTFALATFAPFWSRRAERLLPGIRPQQTRTSWGGMCRALTRFREEFHGDKTRVLAWSPTLYAPDSTRAASAVLELSCLVLDYDDGTPFAEASARWPWPHIGHSSYSHGPDCPKFRIVVPFARPVPARLWARVWAWAEERSKRTIDTKCKDASRVYFVPALRSPDAPHFAEVVDNFGELLDLDAEALPPAPEEKAAQALAEARSRPAPPVRLVHPSQVVRAQREALKNDPAVRLRAAQALGARVTADRATDIRCPRCSRASVWFHLSPLKAHGASCDHRNSCGWHGWLDELLLAAA